MEKKTLENIDKAIDLICEELKGRSAERVIALAKVLRDLVVARAILKQND